MIILSNTKKLRMKSEVKKCTTRLNEELKITVGQCNNTSERRSINCPASPEIQLSCSCCANCQSVCEKHLRVRFK